jgi:hypothetical protein
MATGNVPRGFPRILQWLLAGLMLIIGLAIGILGSSSPRWAAPSISQSWVW